MTDYDRKVIACMDEILNNIGLIERIINHYKVGIENGYVTADEWVFDKANSSRAYCMVSLLHMIDIEKSSLVGE